MKQSSPNTKHLGFPPVVGLPALPGLFTQERGGGMQQPRSTQELARQMQGVTRTSRGFQSLLPDIRALRTQLVARSDRAGLADLAEKIRLWAPGERAPAVTARVLAEAADVFGDAEQWERAAQLLERAIQANPLDESVIDRASATLLRGGAFEELHDVLTAHAHLLDRKVPDDTGARSNAWLRVGRIRAERLRNIDAAIAAYDTAIQIEPDVTALRELSALLETRGKPDDRESAADLYCLLGDLLGGDQGAVYYARALNLNPQHPEALAQLAAPAPGARPAAPAPYTPAPHVPRVSSPEARPAGPASVRPAPAAGPQRSAFGGQGAPVYQPGSYGQPGAYGQGGGYGTAPGAPLANPFAMPQQSGGFGPQHGAPQPNAYAGATGHPLVPATRAAAPTTDSRFAATVLQSPPASHGYPGPVMPASTPAAPHSLAPAHGVSPAFSAPPGFPADATWTADLPEPKKSRGWLAALAVVAVVGGSAAAYLNVPAVRSLASQGMALVVPNAAPATPVEQVQGAATSSAAPVATGVGAAAPATAEPAPSTLPTSANPAPAAPAAPEPEAKKAEREKPADTGGEVAMIKGSLKVSGGRLSRSAAVEALEGALAHMDSCYDKALGKKPKLSGKLSLAFVVKPSGKVGRVQKSSDTLKDSATAACIVRAVEHARFPRPKSVARVKVGLSFSK
jgi:tetratricopeptide (TPR) repeat protein